MGVVQAAGQAHRWMQRDVGHTAFAGMTRGKLLVGSSANRVKECSWQREDALRRARSWHVEGAGRPGCLEQREPGGEQQEMRSEERGGHVVQSRGDRYVCFGFNLAFEEPLEGLEPKSDIRCTF